MAFKVKSFLRPKQGETPESCADAMAYSLICKSANATAAGDLLESAEAGRRYGRFAVADGVSEALLSGEWARALCGAFAEAGPGDLTEDGFIEWSRPLCSAFDDRLRAWADRKYAQDRRYWALPNKANEEGSQSTFMGLRMTEPDADGIGIWRAICVGDCNLTWWNDSGLFSAWPADDPDTFGLTPGVVGSKSIVRESVQTCDGQWRKTDMAVLTSDAMSVWLLKHRNGSNLHTWREWDDSTFDAWLAEERDAERIRNDDCVILFVWWEDEPAETGDPLHDTTDECAAKADDEEADTEESQAPSGDERDGAPHDPEPSANHDTSEPECRGPRSVLQRLGQIARSWRWPLIGSRNR